MVENIDYCKTARKRGCNREKVRLDMYRCGDGTYVGMDVNLIKDIDQSRESNKRAIVEYLSRACDLTRALRAELSGGI